MFGRHAPLQIEIGSGDGRFLIALAERHPEINILGIEVAYEFARKSARKVELKKLWNVKVLPLDAYIALGCLFRHGEIQGIYSNFPDPWPRKKHSKRRLFTREFARIVADRISSGGFVVLATDSPDFRDFAIENMLADGYFETEFDRGYMVGLPDDYPRTRYAEKWMREGKDLYFLRFRPLRRPEQPFVCPIKRSTIMPHVILESIEDKKKILAAFSPFDVKEGQYFVRYSRFFLSNDNTMGLVEAYVGDWRLVQRILIAVKFRENETVVKLDHINHPVVTDGVKLAVKTFADWLASQSGARTVSVRA